MAGTAAETLGAVWLRKEEIKLQTRDKGENLTRLFQSLFKAREQSCCGVLEPSNKSPFLLKLGSVVLLLVLKRS